MFASRLTATFAAFFIAVTTSTPLAAREAVTLDGYAICLLGFFAFLRR